MQCVVFCSAFKRQEKPYLRTHYTSAGQVGLPSTNDIRRDDCKQVKEK